MNGYRTAQAARLAGLSYRQVDNLARQGVVAPSLSKEHAGSGTARRWSHADVELLSVVGNLLDMGVGYEELRSVVEQLRGRPIDHGWLIVSGGHVERVDSLHELGALVAALSPAHVVALHPLAA